MKERAWGVVATFVGLFVILVGLIFRAKGIELGAIPFEGVGASILATGLTFLFLHSKHENPFAATLQEILSEGTQLRRVNQTVDLYFSLSKDRIKLTKRHSFSLLNPHRKAIEAEISMFTDLPTDKPDRGGFVSVETPADGILDRTQLDETNLSRVQGKEVFDGVCTLPPGESNRFVFVSEAEFRRCDRLIWTVQQLSDGFTVRMTNETGVRNPFFIKINHHRDQQVYDGIRKTILDDKEVLEFSIPFTMLPYQGFEIAWRME